MREAILKRVSVRTYSKKSLTEDDRDYIVSRINDINNKAGLNCSFCEDAASAFDSVRKSYGMFKNVKSVIVMKGSKDDSDMPEKVGFYGESLVLDLVDRGIGSCWVGGTFDKSGFNEGEGEKIACVITVGYPDSYKFKDKLIYSVLHKRKPLTERLTADTDVSEEIKRGIEAVIKAPSAVNSQKPHFTLKDGKLSVSVPGDSSMDLIDLGIAKCHFYCETGKEFPLGNNSSVTL